MPPRKRATPPTATAATDYRHDATRLNNPPAGLADVNPLPPAGKKTYSYDPRLDPQLVWAGKAEHTSFDIETVPLYIHERVAPAAIIDSLRSEPVQASLFGDPEFDLNQAVEFYQHPQPWANRLVLGDSLLVMNSLLERELLAGKVQCIYFDPPYGIQYGSNFQPFTNKRDVKDGDYNSLSREPEQIRAFRDTWELKEHTYLTYIRDRLMLMREMLAETGSIFVQISDENVHRIRIVMDEIFGSHNFCTMITFRKKTMPLGSDYFEQVSDYILWYGKNKEVVKTRPLMKPMNVEGDKLWSWVELQNGQRRKMTSEEIQNHTLLPEKSRVYRLVSLLPAQYRKNQDFSFVFQGKSFDPPKQSCWKTDRSGMAKLALSQRIQHTGSSLQQILFLDDYPVSRLTALWNDTGGASDKIYVVQTTTTAIERCILACTDPGDLIFDPTCGSGTSAYVAEQWGRRWITCDTSRVALALARQRLMTATFPMYRLAHADQSVKGGFIYKTAAHITLKSVANNEDIDPIHFRYQEQLEPIRTQINQMLKQTWEEWQIPYGASSSWPTEIQQMHAEWWRLRRERQQAIDAIISHNADAETLYDQPEIERGTVRVAGPFTVEAVQPPALDPDSVDVAAPSQADDAASYLERMVEQLRRSGLTIRGQHVPITRIAPLIGGVLHAEADYVEAGKSVTAAVLFGPQYGPLTSDQLQSALGEARGSYSALIACGFAFDAPAHALMQKSNLRPPIIGVAINADLLMDGLLKTSKASQVFSVFGKPDVQISPPRPDGYTVTVRGVDIYDPNTGDLDATSADQVAAWFLDTDYDGATFLVRQAYFPSQTPNPWERISKALKGSVDPEQFAALQRTTSLPFKAGKHKQCAVKVIDLRGNEVMTVLRVV